MGNSRLTHVARTAYPVAYMRIGTSHIDLMIAVALLYCAVKKHVTRSRRSTKSSIARNWYYIMALAVRVGEAGDATHDKPLWSYWLVAASIRRLSDCEGKHVTMT